MGLGIRRLIAGLGKVQAFGSLVCRVGGLERTGKS